MTGTLGEALKGRTCDRCDWPFAMSEPDDEWFIRHVDGVLEVVVCDVCTTPDEHLRGSVNTAMEALDPDHDPRQERPDGPQ